VITRERFFFATAIVLIVGAIIFWWAFYFAPPPGCHQVGPNKYLCDEPFSGPMPPGQLQR